MTIRILADREPYTAYASAPRPDCECGQSDLITGPSGSVAILNGPAGLDEPSPDILVLPAADFLDLRLANDPKADHGILYIPYGSVDLMEKAFERGCIDYIREPWSLVELLARGGRFFRLKFHIGEKILELRGRRLSGESASVDLTEPERIILRLLILNAPSPIPREAIYPVVFGTEAGKTSALGRCVASLRRKMEAVEPGLGSKLIAIRAFGYRLDGAACA